MLAGFELGNVEMMHKYYADNVTFVSGDYAPPIVGWQNYVPLYQRQATAFSGMQLVRRNTIIFPHGDVAWAMYQWEFDSRIQRAAVQRARPNNVDLQQDRWELADRAQPHIGGSVDSGSAQPPASTQQQPAPAKH